MVVSFVEDHHFILFRATAELLTTALGETFYQHVELLALVLLVLLGRNLRLQGNELIQSANLLFFSDIVGQVL